MQQPRLKIRLAIIQSVIKLRIVEEYEGGKENDSSGDFRGNR